MEFDDDMHLSSSKLYSVLLEPEEGDRFFQTVNRNESDGEFKDLKRKDSLNSTNSITRTLQSKVAEFLSNWNFEEANTVYAIDGHLFDHLVQMKKSEKVDTYVKQIISKFFESQCKVYARMTPDMKAQLVMELQKLGQTVLMCGDGANDCAALRVANIGISLSLEEASIASPFTSTINNISTIKKLLREGKASLVTSFQCFKFMIMYSIIVLIAGSIAMANKTYFADMQFLIVDMFLILPFAILIARTGAYKPLNKAIPTKSLISVSTISSLLIQTLLMTFALLIGMYILERQSWFVPYKPGDPSDFMDDINPGYENTVRNINFFIIDIILNFVHSNHYYGFCFVCIKAV